MTFCGLTVRVDPGTYVPRPQSEVLARRAATFLAGLGPTARAADLCTGTGALACVLRDAAPSATVVGTDRDERATVAASRNGVPTVLCDAGSALAPRSFDLVTAVAPYVPTGALRFLPRDVLAYEPRLALDGGPDGLAVVRRVAADASRLLRTGGRLYLELGGEQDTLVGAWLRALDFDVTESIRDGEGDLRGLVAGKRL